MAPNKQTTTPIVIRTLAWDAMHRIPGHEGACKAFHGHRYTADLGVRAHELDDLGRVIDFSVIKTVVGAWIDTHWDHTAIFDINDVSIATKAIIEENLAAGRPVYLLPSIPTVENIVLELARVASSMLKPFGVSLVTIRLWETPNCSAIWESI